MASLPPGPRFGALQTLRYVRNPYPMLRAAARRYGDVFTIRTGRVCVMTGRPHLVRQIIAAPAEQYGLIREPALARIFGGSGMTSLAGRALRRDRKLILPQFQGAGLAGNAGVIVASASEAMAAWRPGQALTAYGAAMPIALDVILRTVFGAEEPERRAAFRTAVRAFAEGFGNPAFLLLAASRIESDRLPPYRRFAAARQALEALLLGAIERARSGPERAGILGRLVAARYEDGEGLSDAALCDNLITTLVAGHETSALSLCWALFWVHHHPGCLDQLHAELSAAGPAPEAIAALPLLDAVVKETLRLWPAVPEINRVLALPMQLGEWRLPAGTVVAAASAILHYDPELYPDPDCFRPERFLERRFAPYEYLPFGGGERMCPGAQFSVFELKLLLGTLLARGRFTLLERDVPAVRRRGFLMAPRSGVRLRYDGPPP